MSVIKYIIPTEYIHKKIKIIAESKSRYGKKSKPIEKVLDVSCKCDNITILNKVNSYPMYNGEIEAYNREIGIAVHLEQCQNLKYKISGDWQNVENGIIEIQKGEETTLLQLGVYCNEKERFLKEKSYHLLFNKYDLPKLLIGGSSKDREIQIGIGSVVTIKNHFTHDFYFSFDGLNWVHYESNERTFNYDEVGTFELWAFWRDEHNVKSPTTKVKIKVVDYTVIADSDNNILSVGNNLLLGYINK